ncbi:Ig-like domain-containing protein [Candidatus Palauibacter sp.]|uniref:Ig-like domain-containing protein n=1 Tax=Candidatus Palauibacter sp. TaxID=3101350 RepID=UPI003AF26DBE
MTRSHASIAWLAVATLALATACIDGTTAPDPDPPPPNRAPVAVGTIAGLELTKGDSASVDVSAFFHDPDGDALIFEAATSNAGMVTVAVSGGTVTVIAGGQGTATITVAATDPGGLVAQQLFPVTVRNRAPVAVGTIAGLELTKGDSASVDVSAFFHDPDGDALIFEAATSNAGMVTVAVSGGTVTVIAGGQGTATITVAATDPGGLVAQQLFPVTVRNRAPVAVGTIAGLELTKGDSASVDVSAFFHDPDGDALIFEAATSNAGMVTVAVSGGTVTVIAGGQGTATITVAATDPGGLVAQQLFPVTVRNRAPVAVGTIAGLELTKGDSASVDVSAFFHDPDGDALIFEAATSNAGMVTVAVSGGTVTVIAGGQGTATITVAATDPGGLVAQQLFPVTVRNRAPVAVGTIAGLELTKGDSASVDVSAFFHDPDGDALIFEAATSNAGMVTVAVSGGTVTVIAGGQGTATITVAATDPGGLVAQQLFPVTVRNRAPVAVGTIAGLELTKGDSASVDVSAFFHDPDGDALIFEAATSNAGMVTVAVSGGTVTVIAGGQGTATITVAATDPGGLVAQQLFPVTVRNRAPVAVGTIAGLELTKGDSASVDVSAFFHDPDGDALIFEAATSNAGMVTVAVSGGTVTVIAGGQGTATITVAATDPGGLVAQQLFPVTVRNRAPVAVGTIAGLELTKGDSASVDLSVHFEDPDGDGLTLAAETSNADVVSASITGDTLKVAALARGTAVVTVTAHDPGGLSARQTLVVTVPNRAPAPRDSISALELEAGHTATLDASLYFTDADGDTLTYSAVTSNPGTAGVSVAGAVLTIDAVARGTATITATATDPHGLAARQVFNVTVPNRPPTATDAIPDVALTMREIATVDLSLYFTDADGDTLTYSAVTSNPGTAEVSVAGAVLTIDAVAQGTATITATATDPHGLAARQVFNVTVPNRPPTATDAIPDVALTTRDVATVDLSLYFTDADGDTLVYTAEAEDTAIVSTVVLGSRLEVSPLGPGETRIAVAAADPEDARVESSFAVSVARPSTGLLNIELQFQNTLTQAHEAVFRNAAAWWMSTLAETELSDIRLPPGQQTCSGVDPLIREQLIDDLVILVMVVEMDGPGGTLAAAGPCIVRVSSGLPVAGRMRFDAADVARLQESGDLLDVVLHEMAHVLGLGTLWERFFLLRNSSTASFSLDTHFAGRAAIQAFDEAGGTAYTGGRKVPVENSTGRSGADNRHWRRSVFGLELMTAVEVLGVREPVSAITIRSLADLGYSVNTDLADPYRLPLAGAVEAPAPGRAIFRGDDILREPIRVVDADGRTVRVIGNDP